MLPIHLSDFIYKFLSYCSKQKLTSCVILIIPNFLARFVQKMSMTKTKLFSVTPVNFGFILNVTILIVQITGICETMMNPGIAQNVVAQSFPLAPYQATKTSWLVILLWSDGLVVKLLDSQSRGPVFKTTRWLQGRLSLSSFRGQ